jgi:hypothetical protein
MTNVFLFFAVLATVTVLYILPPIRIAALKARLAVRATGVLLALVLPPTLGFVLGQFQLLPAPQPSTPQALETWSANQAALAIGIALLVTWLCYFALCWAVAKKRVEELQQR